MRADIIVGFLAQLIWIINNPQKFLKFNFKKLYWIYSEKYCVDRESNSIICISCERPKLLNYRGLRKIQKIRVRIPAEAIFFAKSLLQFFKIKFGKLVEIIDNSDWLLWKSNNYIGTQLSFLKLIHLNEYLYIMVQHLSIQTVVMFRI